MRTGGRDLPPALFIIEYRNSGKYKKKQNKNS
jgi:hypothetical protein